MESEAIQTSSPASAIRAIDLGAVHQLCSGQVVLSLTTAIKELVENGLDAGASSIEVRLREYGAELVEVCDNGSGVQEQDFEGLALKHHTSKLREFSDLVTVNTFGFRGEALSSLCALSDVCVVTCREDASIGWKLSYDHNGLLLSQTPQSRPPGTTVLLQGLFSTLPVRQKEFLRNIKKEFGKAVLVLQAYALAMPGVRLSCTNQCGQGRRTTVLSTSGTQDLRNTIANIFGPKQLQSLLSFEQTVPSPENCQEFSTHPGTQSEQTLQISGFISKCEHGSGRSATDRQFLFVNRRPCDLPKVSKLINEVYHSYNRHQYPFTCLSIGLEADLLDVNVTPDKRRVLMQRESLLLATLKASLSTMFEETLNQLPANLSQEYLPGTTRCSPCKYDHTSERDCVRSDVHLSSLHKAFSFRDFDSAPGKKEILKQSSFSQPSINRFLAQSHRNCREEKVATFPLGFRSTMVEEMSTPTSSQPVITTQLRTRNVSSEGNDVLAEHSNLQSASPSKTNHNLPSSAPSLTSKLKRTQASAFDASPSHCISVKRRKHDLALSVNSTEEDMPVSIARRLRDLPFCLEKLTSQVRALHERGGGNVERRFQRRFRARIDPSENLSAEEELQKEIRKDSFSCMEVVGQFNRGFVVARLGQDLFIIDQHASDEKYNFERLQHEGALTGQRLITPQKLQLTAVNEALLMENLEVFRKNGFDFIIDKQAAPTQRVCLTTLPTSRGWTFGSSDVDELLFMLSDAPGTMCRPSRVRAMFASRACRQSVMIGTALSASDMKRLLQHMGEMEQPWNCPHGRPTIRHLINLDMVST
uniref:Mismatch repair endonuclease PMS2 n=1 Tax=Eptatretus burgeri TaxID=7764 RepID=A0A8C4QGI1_EPTBU